MGQYDALLRCNLGGTSFQLSDFGFKSDPIVEEGKGQTGIDVAVTGEGWVEAADAAALAAAVAEAATSLSLPGQDLTIVGLGGAVLRQVPAAQCFDGGPHLGYEILPGGSALTRRIRFTLKAKMIAPGIGVPGTDVTGYTVSVHTRPDGLRQVTVKGELKLKGASAFFESRVLPFFSQQFPPAAFVASVTYEGNPQDDSGKYSLDYAELFDPLPVLAETDEVRIVDGQMNKSEERDEQMRLVQTVSFDFLLAGVGDPAKARDYVRRGLDDTPLRERWEVSGIKELRVRGEFVVLLGGGGNRLLNWSRQLVCTTPNTGELDVHPVPGGAPQFVRRAVGGFTYVDSGSATGLGRFPRPPAYFKGITFFAAPPEVGFDHVNAAEKKTTWKYSYLVDTELELDGAALAELERPADPQFFLLPEDSAPGGGA